MNERSLSAPGAAVLTAGAFDRIAAGAGSAADVERLAEAQLSITRALVVAAADSRPGRGPAEEGWRALSELDREPAARWAVRSVLSHPYVRPWAAGCLRPLRSGALGPAYLGSLAAAAAIRAGVDIDIPVPVHGGVVFLPTVGSVTVPPAGATATVSVTAGGFQVRCGEQVVVVRDRVTDRAPVWRAARWFREDGFEILLEDADPHRDSHPWSTAGRLTDPEVRGWRHALSAAWTAIGEDAPEQVDGLRTGFRAITPLNADPAGRMRSSTVRGVFGAAGVALAAPDALAVMIVHEFQRSKLGAMFDLHDLYDRAYAGRLRVGWRDGPRPVEGVFQDAYAHLAVAGMWRTRASHGRAGAVQQFRRYRDWTAEAIEALFASAALTPSGEEFLRRTADTLASWT